MSHGIAERDKMIGTFKQWHGLNEVVEKIDETNNVLLRYDNKAVKLQTDEGKETGYSMLVSSDDGLPVGVPFQAKSYKFNTNKAFVDMVNASLVDVPHQIDSAGTVHNRGKLIMSIKLLDAPTYEVGARKFEDYLSFLDSVDKSTVLAVVNSSICTVCANTFAMNLAHEGHLDVRVKHTSNFHAVIQDVPKIIQGALLAREGFYKNLTHFSEFPMNLGEAEQFFAGWLGQDANGNAKDLTTYAANTVERLKFLFNKGAGNEGKSLLDLFQAITDFYTHESSAPKAMLDKPDRNTIANQFESSEFGDGANTKREFYKTLCKFLTVENGNVSWDTSGIGAIAKIGDTLLVSYHKAKKEGKTPKQAKLDAAQAEIVKLKAELAKTQTGMVQPDVAPVVAPVTPKGKGKGKTK
jgi:uncharacterized protein DUF932